MNNWIKHACLVLLGLMGLKSTTANAAVDISLCIDGIGAITKSNMDCIDVLAWSWGAANSGTVGNLGNTNFQDISITKYQDNTSTFLLQSLANSKSLPPMLLRVRASCGEPDCLGTITAQYTAPAGSVVTSVSTGGSGGESRLTENVTFNLPGLQWCYAQLDATGTPVQPLNLVCAEKTFVVIP